MVGGSSHWWLLSAHSAQLQPVAHSKVANHKALSRVQYEWLPLKASYGHKIASKVACWPLSPSMANCTYGANYKTLSRVQYEWLPPKTSYMVTKLPTKLLSADSARLRPVALSYVNTIPSAAPSPKKTEFAKIETSLPTFSHISTLQPTIQQPFKHSFVFVTTINVESLVNLWNQSTLCEYNGMRTRVVHKSIK